MTTSNIYIYQLSRDDIIKSALRKLGVIAQGQSPSAEDTTNAAMALNTVIAMLRTKGLPLWARRSYVLPMTANKTTYTFGVGQEIDTAYPVHLLQAIRKDANSGAPINMDIVPNYNFQSLPVQPSGPPIQVSYQPQVNSGVLSVWPTPDSYSQSNVTITLTYQVPFQYFNSSTDTLDMPEEWYLAVIYQLAVALAPEWGVPLPDRGELKQQAKTYLDAALENGQEDASVFIQPIKR